MSRPMLRVGWLEELAGDEKTGAPPDIAPFENPKRRDDVFFRRFPPVKR